MICYNLKSSGKQKGPFNTYIREYGKFYSLLTEH